MTLRYRVLAVLAFVFVAGVLLAPAPSSAQCDAPTVCIPQPSCQYYGPQPHLYPPTPVGIRNLVLRNPSHCEPPPSPGAFLDSFFDIFYDFELSTDNGATWVPRSGSTTGTIRMISGPTPASPIELELLSLDLTSSSVFGPVHIRESPSRPSLGRESPTLQPTGRYNIDSFFDVFTELSLDGGQTWIPDQQPNHLTLLQENPTPTRVSSWGSVKSLYR
jgi:hypothetical protein